MFLVSKALTLLRMGDREEDEDLQMAIRLSMQKAPPEHNNPRDAVAGVVSGSPESKFHRRELMAAAAEKRMAAAASASPTSSPAAATGSVAKKGGEVGKRQEEVRLKGEKLSKELSVEEANKLFVMVFGSEVSKGILAQWSNQGIR